MNCRVGILLLLLPFLTLSQQNHLELAASRANLYEQKVAFENYWADKDTTKGKGYKPFMRYLNYWEPRVFPSGNMPDIDHNMQEYQRMKSEHAMSPSRNGSWIPLGPLQWAPSGSWNPGIGRVNCLAICPSDTNIILAGAASGGIWRSSNAGQNWDPVSDDFALLGISGLAFDPDEPQVVYAATGDGDGFSTHGFGILISQDAGLTWTTTSLAWSTDAFTLCRNVKVSPHDKETVYALTNKGLFRSLDKGNTWTWVCKAECRDMEFHPSDPSIVYASSSDHVYRSVDGGGFFQVADQNMPDASEVSRWELAVSADAPDVVYAIAAKQSTQGFLGLYISTDKGQSFSLRCDSPNLLGYSTSGSDLGGQGWYDLAFEVDPDDWQHLYVGGVNVWETQDGGDSWDQVAYWLYPNATGYCHADVHRLTLSGQNLFACTDGGVYRMDILNGQWSDLTNGIQISQFYKVDLASYDPEIMLASAQDNGTFFRDTSGGFHAVVGADGMESSLHPTNPDVMFCTYQFGGLMKSHDGGANFTYVDVHGGTEAGAWETPHMFTPNGTFMIGYLNMWKSSDNGVTFTKMGDLASFNSSYINEFDVSPSNPNVIYVSKADELFVSLNGGISWDEKTNGLPQLSIAGIAVHPSSPSTVYVCLSGFEEGQKVFRSMDYGTTWENISRNLPNVPSNCIMHHQDQGLVTTYLGTDIGIMVITDGLVNWVPFDNGLPNVPVNDLEIQSQTQQIVAATYGRGLWQSDLADFSSELPVADFKVDLSRICAGNSVTFTDLSTFTDDDRTWAFPGGTPSSATAYQPQVTYTTPGQFPVAIGVDNINGSDQLARYDYITVYSPTLYPVPYREDFENMQELMDRDIVVDNPDNISTWDLTNLSIPNANQCAWLANEQHMPNNSDLMTGPPINLSGQSELAMSFKYSFTKKNDLSSDQLKVFFSYDCGGTWEQVMDISTTDLTTAVQQPESYSPQSNGQWAHAVIPVNPGGPGFRYRFEFISGGGNNIYLDDIMVSKDAGIGELPTKAASIYPNPSQGVFQVLMDGKMRVTVLNTMGQVVMRSEGTDMLTLDLGHQPEGIYFLNLESEGTFHTQRIVVER